MTAPDRLRATTEAIPDPGDLLDLLEPGGFAFVRRGAGLVAGGSAGDVPVDRVAARLESITTVDPVRRPGTGPIAVGALPFHAPGARLRIPRWVVGRDAAGAWRTRIEGGSPAGDAGPGPDPAGPARVLDRAEFVEAVETVLERIAAGEVAKVVLARAEMVDLPGPVEPAAVLRRLAGPTPDAWLFADAGFIGASPELLVTRRDRRVLSLPTAGTVPAGEEHRLLTTAKLTAEFRFVADAVATALRSVCATVDVRPGTPRRSGNIAHLSALVEGRLADPDLSALDLAAMLHPTPAVGGVPTDAALALITKLEVGERGAYSGPVGWVDARGDGSFAVALRCARLLPGRAVLHAGSGIVAGSRPGAEWAETEAKLETMRAALATG